jgi:nitrogen fixation protein FixH
MRTLTKGERLEVMGTFTDVDGQPVDPDEVRFRIRRPNGNITTVAATDEAVRNPEPGTYVTEVNLDQHGTWHIRVESSGIGQAATEQRVAVLASAFD